MNHRYGRIIVSGTIICMFGVIVAIVGICTACTPVQITLEPTEVPFIMEAPKAEIPFQIPAQYEKAFVTAALRHNIPLWVLARTAYRESGFNPNEIGDNGTSIDLGMFQFNNRYLGWFCEKYGEFDPMNPYEAVEVAAQHLAWLHEQTGNWPDAIAAWNCGLTRCKIGRWPEITERHVDAVLGI